MLKLAASLSRLGTESAFEILARAQALAAQGKAIINLGIGQPDFKTPKHIVEAGIQALRDGHHGYTPANGLPQVREAVAADLQRRHGSKVDPDCVVIVPGGKPTMFFAILMFGEPGAEIMYPNPGFPIYESLIKYSGATPVPIMFIEVVYEESKDHPYGDPDIEVAKVALRTFIKHRPDEVQVTIPVGEHEFIVRRVDEITKYEYHTYSYKTFQASAWSVPLEGGKRACTTTYEFRTFADEEAFVVSTSPSNGPILTFEHAEAIHSHAYWQRVNGKKVINELISLLEQKVAIIQLIELVNDLQPDAGSARMDDINVAIEHAQRWLCESNMMFE